MNASVVWSHGMSFTGTADSGFSIPLGTDPSVGGDDDGPRPMELLAIGLAGCTAMDVISILNKKRQKVNAFAVQVQADRAAEHPKVFTAIHIHYVVRGVDIDPAAVQRAIELSEQKYCPAQAMFSRIVPVRLTYEIVLEDAVVA